MKNLFTTEYKSGDKVRDQFVLKHKDIKKASNGSVYLLLNLKDREGELLGKKWSSSQEEYDSLVEGKVYEIIGECDSYMGKIQLVVQLVTQVPEDEVRPDDFLPKSKFSEGYLKEKITGVIASVKDEDYSKILKFIFDSEGLETFCRWPAGKELHHATIGGLAEHVLSLTESAEFFAKKYNLDRDLLIAGTLLHDWAKVLEYKVGNSFDFTTIGKLSGHISIGFAKVLEAGKETNSDLEKTYLLGHMVLSHHEAPEYGSPVRSMIPEAFVLHHIDDLDFQMDLVSHIPESSLNNGWSDWIRALDRKIYLGNKKSGSSLQGGEADEAISSTQKIDTDSDKSSSVDDKNNSPSITSKSSNSLFDL